MEAYKTNPQKDESAIARLLIEASLAMPDPNVIKLGSEIEQVLDTYGTPFSDSSQPKTVRTVMTPPVVEKDYNGVAFGFGLKKQTTYDASHDEGFSTLELYASGIDGSTTTCAVIDGGKLRVEPLKTGDLPRINEQSDIAYVRTVVRDISRKLDFETVQRETARQRKLDISRRTLLKGLAVSAGLAALGGVGHGLSQVDWEEFFKSKTKKFDEMNLKLTGGSVAMLGQTVTPEFSAELISRPEFAEDNIPILTLVSRGKTSSPDDNLEAGDGLRQIRMHGGFGHFWPWEADRAEVGSVAIEGTLPTDAKLRVWTSLSSAAGESRADELRLTFLHDRLEYVWAGRRVDSETARIVVLLEN